MSWFFFNQKNKIKPGINLKLVPKFQDFCYTLNVQPCKCSHKVTQTYRLLVSRVTMGCHFHKIIFLFLSCTSQSLLDLFPYYKAQVHHN